MDVTVLTPTVRGRRHLLLEAQTSVLEQTVPVTHAIAFDFDRQGPAWARNLLLERVRTPWVAFLDDDDLLDPHHVETLLANADGADVVVPYCRFDGRELPPRYCNRPYDRAVLRRHGIFPVTVLARTEAVRAAGCFDPADRYEDWSMFNRMADNGAVFRVVPIITWTYRRGHPCRTDETL